MFLKFKINQDSETEEWKFYSCKNFSYKIFNLHKILDFLIYIEKHKDEPIEIDIPSWVLDLDLTVIPYISKELKRSKRIITEEHSELLLTKCIHFQILPIHIPIEKIHVLTTNDVYILGDKGQTVDRINPNNM